MFPTICSIGPFKIYSYGLMLVIAFSVAASLSGKQAKKEGIDPDKIFNLLFYSFVWGVAGARVFFVLENLGFYLKNPLEIIMLQHGGLAWFGGLIMGSVAGVVYLRRNKLSIYKALDLIAPFLALAQAIGRIGCLFNGCCFGKISKFGLYFPAHEAQLIPTQLYSSVLLLVIFFVLRFLQDRPHAQGRIFYAYLLLYSIKRFFIEFLRADNPVIAFHLTLFQLLSIAVFILALFKLCKTSR